MATVYRPVTEAERALVAALRRCTFPIGSSPKRFARELANQVEVKVEITEAQAAHLRRLVSTYRRQIRAESLPEAEHYLLTDAAARAAREGERAEWWIAVPGRPVPSWVVRLTGVSTVEAIVAKWGEGARFERQDARTRAARRPTAPAPTPTPAPAAPEAQLSLLAREGG